MLYYIYTSVAPMHKCIGFAVSSVVVSCLAASNIISDPTSNTIFDPTSNLIFAHGFEHVFERKDSECEVSEREVSERLR